MDAAAYTVLSLYNSHERSELTSILTSILTFESSVFYKIIADIAVLLLYLHHIFNEV